MVDVVTEELLPSRELANGFAYLEGPRWHDGALWASDVLAGRVVRIGVHGTVTEVARLDDRPSGIGFLPDGRPLVVSMERRQLLALGPDGTHTVHSELGALGDGPCNDLVVDDGGRAWVSTFDGAVLRVEPDGSAVVAADGFAFPNGMVLAGSTLIVAETSGARLTALEVGADGTLDGRRTFAELPGESPDGIALDAEGAVWVASALRGRFLRVRTGGEVTHRIEAGAPFAQACALGGADGRTLFLLTADTSTERWAAGDSIGWVRAATVDVPGSGWPC